ncbi:MAG: hypothetical protein HQK99_03005 [Nitrospirae bacterium]|nr:hypothetical protein [Nitrospirota bacterium]
MMTSKGKKGSVSKVSGNWKGQIEAWRASGSTQAEYCRQHELKLKAFTYQKRKFDKSATNPVFHQVRIVEEEAKTSPSLSLILGMRYRIEVRDGFNPATLDLLETLEK